MGQEGTVGPRERVNIVYTPATGDAQEEVELPFKVMVMGDFTQREDETAVEDRKVVNVDKDNFNEVMKEQELNLKFNVDDKLSDEEGEEIGVDLNFDTLKDFDPGAIAKQVPELKKILDLREALTALKGPLANVPAFRKKIEALLQDPDQRAKLVEELGIEESGE